MNPEHQIDPSHRAIRDATINDATAQDQVIAVERASAFATHGDPSKQAEGAKQDTEGRKGTVEFVRASDVAQRAGRVAAVGAHRLGRTAQDSLYSAVSEAVREQAGKLRSRVAEREAHLTPEDPNRIGGRTPVTREGVGR